jgi:transposase
VAAECFVAAGAVIVAVQDHSGTVQDPRGLDIAALTTHCQQTGGISGFRTAEALENEDFWDIDADILIPAALEGQITAHHRFLLRELMRHLAFLEGQVARYEKRIKRQMPPFEWAAELLMTMPGVDRTAASALIAEIGTDMSHFASSRHLASWAGLCPGNNESAGKRRSGKSHRGSRWIKGLMTEIAWAATRTKNTYSQTQYRKLTGHRGKKRALVAVANSLLQAAWHMLSQHQAYKDLGSEYLERLNQKQLERSLIRRLEKLGHKVILEAVA